MFGRARARKYEALRYRILRSEVLEPRTMLSAAPPTIVHPIAVSGSQTITGNTASLSVLGNDAAGAAKLVYNWSLGSEPAGGSAAFGANGTNAAANTTLTFTKAGSYGVSVKIVDPSGLSVTNSLTLVVASKLSYVTVSQLGSSLITGTSVQFNVSTQDQFHTTFAGTTKTAWTTSSSPAGSGAPIFTTGGATSTATVRAAGQYKLTVIETDNSGNVVSQAITVSITQQITGVSKSLTSSLSVAGTSAKLVNPTIVDQFGNPMATQPALTWTTATSPSGATAPSLSTASGVTTVTFATAGTYAFTAKLAGTANLSFVETATVAQTLSSVVVTPNTASVGGGKTQPFAAQGFDQFKHAMQSQPAFTWSASGGSISTAGLFTAPNTSGTDTITAQSGSVSASATVSVTAPSNFLNLQNSALASLVQSLDADGSISRDDMIQILDGVEAAGAVTASELADLKTIVNHDATTLNMPGYVQVLAGDVVDGNTANATYLGNSLGNLAAGSSAVQLSDLIGKWFLGTDLPTLTSSSYSYQTASGSLFPTTPSNNDEYQGELGDCYFISSLGTIADRDPAAIEDMFINNGDGTYTVRFYTGNYGSSYNSSTGTYSDGFTSGSGTADYVTVNLSLPTSGGRMVYADFGDLATSAGNSLWIPLAEKAYAQWNQTGQEGRDGTDSYAGIESGWMATVDAQILGHNATDYNMNSSTQQQLVNALASGLAVTIGTNSADMFGLYGSHAYAVTAYNASSNTFTLYNPWGSNQPGQLTWSQLTQACGAFCTVNAAGATAISGAVLRSGSIGYFASDSINPAPADTGLSNVTPSDAWFDHGGTIAAASNASHDFLASSAADGQFTSSSTTGASTRDFGAGDWTSFEAGTDSTIQDLAVDGWNLAGAVVQNLLPSDLFYALLGAA